MKLEQRIRQVEAETGKRIIVRGVRSDEADFRGRLIVHKGYCVLEYRDDEPGYFWHVPIIEELLRLVQEGRGSVTLLEGGRQFIDVPLD